MCRILDAERTKTAYIYRLQKDCILKDQADYLILDIETTGGNFRKEKITEIALYRFDGKNILDEYNTLINPGRSIPWEISRMTGITNEMVRYAPAFPEVARRIVEMTESCILVGHNISFDYGFLREEFRQLGYAFRRDTMCTLKLARKLIPGLPSYSLGKLCASLGIPLQHRHRAGGDAMATLRLFQLLLSRLADDRPQIQGWVASEVREHLLDHLPHATGVYFFHDEKDEVIYVGKSTDIRQRVSSHLINDRTVKGNAMRDRIHRVSFEITGSETLALLRESEEIKRRMPVYNVRSRRKAACFGIYVREDEEGYLRLSLDRLKPEEEPMMPVATKKEGRAMLTRYWEEYQLCQKLCGLYQSNHACFHYSVKQCLGACIGRERPAEYNIRVQHLIDALVPPLKDYILVDKGRTPGENVLIRVVNGSYTGYAYVPEKLLALKSPASFAFTPQEHNRDTLQILLAALREKNYRELIPY